MEERNYTTIYRVMHWAIALCMIFMLITIFLRLTWMNKEHVADIIQNYIATLDTSLSREQLIILAKQIRKPMWDWHVYTGYVLVGLYGLRMALPLIGKMKFSNPLEKQLTKKMKFQYWLYLAFYGCVAISLATGLIIELGPKTFKATMESIHVLSIYYLIAFIILHIGGIVIAELTNQQGIISRMVSGTKNKQATSS
ncbi:MAG: cytochrome B [Flavobacteriaceae bacterium CG_4_8_14_3_um_filter_34_10]|nr:MAG: cytochrome B [Flavobacteriaceae bacterium CG2_30_34_30]PIQ19331.1 MAG: cytochrome B [Flavobacteriaceae bacterium CG18_big_fil_WC_8_21_14_2_50_34_36]PIV51120.1 MAG: cytochrome B [Flavobacteriaceae bacterium CG02_land_8_20_14_3_00_34_13]PIX09501.1 MAG: cytochrome B [Flavobacteriaceae bacterium CG_4_8_14_3_um_filter_34_10]PIZ07888.1 MAG: cytochrome B [Flavobacteriaceae bacterium CG_4_10_14_0_8_um_filter_34_31]